MNSKIKFLGNEPENIKKRIVTLFTKLDEAYPDKTIISLSKDHKKWDETAREISKQLGYEDKNAFLIAYGYKIEKASPGREKTVFGDEIIAELQRRYPNGSEYTKANDLFAANPDLETKKKTLSNQAKEMFGMTLGKYLISIGLIQRKIQSKEEDTFDYEGHLKKFAAEVKKRLVGVDFIPYSTSKLSDYFANMDFQLARRCVKKVYGDTKTLDTYLQEVGALRTPLDENAEMLYCVDILKARYKKSKKLPTKLSELASENPDLPITNLNKYIREVIGEKKAAHYYIRNRILQGKDTDLLEYVFCQVKVPQENHSYYYISKVEDLKVRDKVVVESGWHGKIIGTVHYIKTCIGLDAPCPVSQTKNILRKAREEEINNNIVNWTDDDKWLYQWQEDDANEEYASKNIPQYPPLISIKTYLEGKKNLVDFIQHEQAINTMYLSNIYGKTQLPSFLFDNVGLQGGTYLENERLYTVMSRVHNTSNQTSVQVIEQLQKGDILLCNFSNAIYIKSQSNVTIGHISNDISDFLLPMLIKKYASIKEVKVSYVRPLSKMVPQKKHPALYVILVIELADMTKNMTEGSCVAMYGYDWKVNATQVSFLKTTIPLGAAIILFDCGKRYSGVRPFKRDCQEYLGSYSIAYKKIEPYITGMCSSDYDFLYKLFYKYAVDETIIYSLEGEIVPFATWDANAGGGFNHWCETLLLFDISAEPEDALDGFFVLDEIVVAVG